jgi:hypothetical protein
MRILLLSLLLSLDAFAGAPRCADIILPDSPDELTDQLPVSREELKEPLRLAPRPRIASGHKITADELRLIESADGTRYTEERAFFRSPFHEAGKAMLDYSPEFLAYLFIHHSFANNGTPFFAGSFKNEQFWTHIKKADLNFDGVPKRLKNSWQVHARSIFDQLIEAKENNTQAKIVPSTKQMFLYLKALKDLRAEDIEPYVRFVAEHIGTYMKEKILNTVTAPKIHYIAKQIVLKNMGLEYLPLTNVVLRKQDGGAMEVRIISLDPMTSKGFEVTEVVGGLYVIRLPNISVADDGKAGDIITHNLSWRVGNKRYHANLQVILGAEIDSIAPTIKTLDYKKMWADKKLTGAILPGSSMGDFTYELLSEYKAYFRSRGFRFSQRKVVSDFTKFLREAISSGRLDYVVVEKHAGNPNDFVNEGEIHIGRKRLSDGNEEVIYVYYPHKEKQESESGKLISHRQIAEWMKIRQSSRYNGQLLWADTSCSALDEVHQILNVVKDANLVGIASSTSATTFTNDDGSAIFHLLNGLRKGHNFSEIRDKLKKNVVEYRREVNDTYRFPDDPQWKEEVRDNIRGEKPRTYDLEVQVTDERGQAVNMSDFFRQARRQAF